MSSCHTNHVCHHCCCSSSAVLRPHLETPWPTRRGYSDRGSQFISNFTWSLSQLVGSLSGSFHGLSPADGCQTERVNKEVKHFLWLFMNPTSGQLVWMAIHSWVHIQWPGPCLHMLIPIYDGHWTEPHLCIELLRESCLEMLMTSPLRWKQPQRKCTWLSPRQQMTWPNLYDTISGKHHCLWSETRSGSMGRTHHDLSDEEIGPQVAQSIPSGQCHIQSAYQLKLLSSFSLTHPVSQLPCCNPTMQTPFQSEFKMTLHPSHLWWSWRIWGGMCPRQSGLLRETQIPCTMERI